jgi:hypothetical protein
MGGTATKQRQQAVPYEPPAILWEQTFIALAQVTPPVCHPGSPPPCP